MARHKLTKDQQIKGLKKALKNPKTPKQFLAGMRKRLARLTVLAFVLLAPRIAHAQFIGYTTPQTVQQTLASATSCVGGLTFTINNLGQSIHQVFVSGSGSSPITVTVNGSTDGVRFTKLIQTTIGTQGLVTAQGYYSIVQVTESCSSGTVTSSYVGTSVPNTQFSADTDATFYDQNVCISCAAGSNLTPVQTVPFGSSYGFIVFQYNAAGPANSTLQVLSNGTIVASSAAVGAITPAFTLSTGTSQQVFFVPNVPAENVQINYTAGGASANTYKLEYYFFKPGNGLLAGAQPPNQSNTEQTSAANSAVSKTITGLSGVRAHLFSVSARCSAGTAQLTVSDGGTQIWSTAATEVATTTFRFQWNPGLAGTSGQNMVVTLGTCGAANTGTLDAQTSQF